MEQQRWTAGLLMKNTPPCGESCSLHGKQRQRPAKGGQPWEPKGEHADHHQEPSLLVKLIYATTSSQKKLSDTACAVFLVQ